MVFEGDYSYAAFTADSKQLVAFDVDKKTLNFINVATGKVTRTLTIPFERENDFAQGVAVSHDGKKIAVRPFLRAQ